jgi:hypothetical protein
VFPVLSSAEQSCLQLTARASGPNTSNLSINVVSAARLVSVTRAASRDHRHKVTGLASSRKPHLAFLDNVKGRA